MHISKRSLERSLSLLLISFTVRNHQHADNEVKANRQRGQQPTNAALFLQAGPHPAGE